MHEAPCPNPKLYDAGKCCGGACFDLARTILNVVREDGAYVGDESDLHSVMIDGHVDLLGIVAAIVAAHRNRTATTECN